MWRELKDDQITIKGELQMLSKRLVSPAFSDSDGCAELSTLKRSVRSSLRRC